MSKTIKFDFWLRFSRGGGVHSTKNPPALAVDERAMKCSVELPLSLFTRPQLTASIIVDELPEQGHHFDVHAAETALSEVLGADVIFTVRQPDEGDTP